MAQSKEECSLHSIGNDEGGICTDLANGGWNHPLYKIIERIQLMERRTTNIGFDSIIQGMMEK